MNRNSSLARRIRQDSCRVRRRDVTTSLPNAQINQMDKAPFRLAQQRLHAVAHHLPVQEAENRKGQSNPENFLLT